MEDQSRSERRSSLRTAVVWDAVQSAVQGFDAPARVVDVGGGTGGFAVRLAGQGHHVTVVDPSPDALAALGRRAAERGVTVTGVQGDVANLGSLVDEADLVLCHSVLGVVADPAAAVAAIGGVLRPGGVLSLLVGQRHAAVLHSAMAGNLAEALDQLADRASGERRFTGEELTGLLTGSGFTTVRLHAARVFTDLVPSSLLDGEPGAVEQLLALERAVADRPEYFAVGTQLHALARH